MRLFEPFRSQPRSEDRMAIGFAFRLELADGKAGVWEQRRVLLSVLT
jgi:hypothetical protein